MDRAEFLKRSSAALEHIEGVLGDLEHENLDVELAADVLTLTFGDDAKFIINAHSAAGQVWMAANRHAWHFDWNGAQWVASASGDELMATVTRTVSEKLGEPVEV